MRYFYRALRALLVVAIVLAVTVPAVLFVALSMRSVQDSLRKRAERELSHLTQMDVRIGDVVVAPFSRLTLRRVALLDSAGDTVMAAQRLGAGLSLAALVFKQSTVVTYTEIIGLDVRLRRDSMGAPLNIQPMLDAFAPRDTLRPPTPFDFRVNTVVIRQSALTYDVMSTEPDTSRFDPNHIAVSDLRADLRLPLMANDNFNIVLRRMAAAEHSGLRLEQLDGEFHITPDSAWVNGVSLRFPDSKVELADAGFAYPSLKEIKQGLLGSPIHGGIKPGSYINPADLAPLLPGLSGADCHINMAVGVGGNLSSLRIENLDLTLTEAVEAEPDAAPAIPGAWLSADASVRGLPDGGDRVSIEMPRLSAGGDASRIVQIVGRVRGKEMPAAVCQAADSLGTVDLLGHASLGREDGSASVNIITGRGQIDASGHYKRQAGGYEVTAEASLPGLDCGPITAPFGGAAARLTAISATASLQGVLLGKNPSGRATLHLDHAAYGGSEFADIELTATRHGRFYGMALASDNPDADLTIDAELERESGGSGRLRLNADVRRLLMGLVTQGRLAGEELSLTASADMHGKPPYDMAGYARLNDVRLTVPSGRPLEVDTFTVTAAADSAMRRIELRSSVADATLSGRFTLGTLTAGVRKMLAGVFPALLGPAQEKPARINGKRRGMPLAADSAVFALTVKRTDPLGDVVKLPVNVIYPITAYGVFDAATGTPSLDMSIDAPYLQQGNKLLEKTALRLQAEGDSAGGTANLYATMLMPTKKGDMTLGVSAFGSDNRVSTKLQWRVDRNRDFHGDIDFAALLGRTDDGRLSALLDVNRSTLVFNDTAWTIEPSQVSITPGLIEVNDFKAGRPGQYVTINGTASPSLDDSVTVKLSNMNLDYVFETLDIQTAMFGGEASGSVYAVGALGQSPRLYTDGLDVKRLSYNHSLMGDTHIRSQWLPDERAIALQAQIHQPNGCTSSIDGRIMPLSDSLDFNFDADKIEVGFMLPFMEAFTSQVSGYASGKARLWGSFKYIDMVGDIYAQDLKLKLDFTNTTYSTTDSVHLRPGHIDLSNITLHDRYGNSATLNGWLTHEYFKKPRFHFAITNARDMLVYDIPQSMQAKWYGRIFGNGNATIDGVPGRVDIGVEMSTAAKSSFTFVLSDAEQAYDYTFITFRDREREAADSAAAAAATPEAVRLLRQRIAASSEDGAPSIYRMNIAVDVNPNAQVNLIMDPVGGDRIRAWGNGNLRLTYDSQNEDLRMFGTYTLQRGSYNFTLQDIIIKDFTIRDGSSITFNGDPFAAQLDIDAIYSVNANLSDLDESFLQDKELARTNVPVHALLMVSGDMRAPDINFDLEFPTLTQDTYRKVRSIVSTDDMMNRQIIYLLALSRFYTPDYMNTTKGNELVSVASSTISSQLGSILGQLSDNWSIMPNFRSDRGDFSDVEVDLALSSHLLNNRLLLNGNFGYRDKSLNNNTFIGDFDIEYLLNRSGSIRLKAYNRYNDRNYYVRSALTTQGVGVVFKRDFDNIFSFLRRKKRVKVPKLEAPRTAGSDTTAAPADTTGPMRRLPAEITRPRPSDE